MQIPFWFKVEDGLGYGVKASSKSEADSLLKSYGYPRAGETIVGVTERVAMPSLDAKHVLPNVGPLVVRGVWFPRHNV